MRIRCPLTRKPPEPLRSGTLALHAHPQHEYPNHGTRPAVPKGRNPFMAVWAKYLEVDLFGEELLAGRSTKIEWLKPVFAGDVLTGRATVTKAERRNARNGLVEISITACNQHGEVVLTNATEAVVNCRPAAPDGPVPPLG